MKTAEDYAHELCCKLTACGAMLSYTSERELKRIVQETLPAIQLDAMKEGARRAGQICNFTIDGNGMADAAECHTRILSAAEQWTEKDL